MARVLAVRRGLAFSLQYLKATPVATGELAETSLSLCPRHGRETIRFMRDGGRGVNGEEMSRPQRHGVTRQPGLPNWLTGAGGWLVRPKGG